MQFKFPRLTPTVKKILLVMAVAFVATAVLENVVGVPVFSWLALDVSLFGDVRQLPDGTPWWPALLRLAWQPVTYWLVWPPRPDFLFSAGLSLLFTYFFLSSFEEAYGPKRVLQISAVGVLSSGVGCTLVSLVYPTESFVYGGSVIVDAVIGAFPILFAGRKLYLIPFPFAIKPWAFVGVALGLAALGAVLATDAYVFLSAAFALGGGLLFAKWMTRPRGPQRPNLGPKKKRKRGGPNLTVLEGGADDDRPRYLN